MEQKRKVKSLLPCKINKDKKGLTFLLLSLSVILCIGSVSLMTKSVMADDGGSDNVRYTGMNDDNVEVLYRLHFSDRMNFGSEVVNEFYMSGDSLYLVPNQVVLSGNTVDTGKYINVLGGLGNEVGSDNITVVAGRANKIYGDNTGASILGGDGNIISGSSSGAPAVIAGGLGNSIDNNNGNVILGGKSNGITGSLNSVILGGEGNGISGSSNVIVGGSGVRIGNLSGIFAFSDGMDGVFSPEMSNAFYLNLSGGVGINVDAGKRGISVSGAVGFGEINIITKSCDESNIGVVGNWDGCLVGCTDVSKGNGGKWELLDRGSQCEIQCSNKSDKCINSSNSEVFSSYDKFCVGNVSTGNATLCPGGQANSNFVSQIVLIDSNLSCPSTDTHNECIFRCNKGTRLNTDRTKCE